MSNADRNKPCHCGSGVKTKRCPGPHAEDYRAAYAEYDERERDAYITERLAHWEAARTQPVVIKSAPKPTETLAIAKLVSVGRKF